MISQKSRKEIQPTHTTNTNSPHIRYLMNVLSRKAYCVYICQTGNKSLPSLVFWPKLDINRSPPHWPTWMPRDSASMSVITGLQISTPWLALHNFLCSIPLVCWEIFALFLPSMTVSQWGQKTGNFFLWLLCGRALSPWSSSKSCFPSKHSKVSADFCTASSPSGWCSSLIGFSSSCSCCSCFTKQCCSVVGSVFTALVLDAGTLAISSGSHLRFKGLSGLTPRSWTNCKSSAAFFVKAATVATSASCVKDTDPKNLWHVEQSGQPPSTSSWQSETKQLIGNNLHQGSYLVWGFG